MSSSQNAARYESKCFNRNLKRLDLEKEIFNRIKNLETSGEIEFTKKAEPIDYEKRLRVSMIKLINY